MVTIVPGALPKPTDWSSMLSGAYMLVSIGESSSSKEISFTKVRVLYAAWFRTRTTPRVCTHSASAARPDSLSMPTCTRPTAVCVQWAAVSTHEGWMSVPPQKWLPRLF